MCIFFSATIKKYPNQQNRLYKYLYINVREPCFIEHTRTVPEPVAEPFFSFFSGSLFGSSLVRVFSFLKMIKSLLYQRFQHVVRVVRFFLVVSVKNIFFQKQVNISLHSLPVYSWVLLVYS